MFQFIVRDSVIFGGGGLEAGGTALEHFVSSQESSILQFDRDQLPFIVSNVVKLNAKHSLESAHLWELLDLLPVAVLISSDRDCTHIVGNVAARALLNAPPIQNLSRSAPEGQKPPFQVYANGQLLPSEELPMQKAASTGVPVPRSECELRFDNGARVFIAGHSVPIFDANGVSCGSIGAFVDVTHVKHLEEENRLLTGELSHRVKNIVSIIQAISYQTIRPLISSQHYATFEKRLIAIAKAHELLFEKKSARPFLEEVIIAALSPIIEWPSGVVIKGPAVELSEQSVHAIIMILHELGTNSIKYGALSESGGLVEIHWHEENRGSSGYAVIHWEERGGPLVAKPKKTGFGTKMIEAAARNVTSGEVKLNYHPSGVQCKIVLPAALTTDAARNFLRLVQ